MGRSCRSRLHLSNVRIRILSQQAKLNARLEVPENGNRHRVLPTFGGNGVNLGGIPKNSKKVKRMHAKVYDRTGPHVVHRSLGKTSDERLSRFFFNVLFFVADRSFTADGGPLQPTGGVKTTPHKTRFSSVKYTRNLDSDQNWVHEYSDKNCLDDTTHKHKTKPDNVCSDLKHLGNTWAWASTWFSLRSVFAVSLCFCCSLTHSLCTHCGLRCSFLSLIPSHSHLHVACMLWVTFSSTSPSTSLSSSSSSLASITSFCSSPSLRLSSSKPCARPPSSRVPRTACSPPQDVSPMTTSSQRLKSSSIRSPWPSNGSPKSRTSTTPWSVGRFSTRTEDKSITLNEKACRPVCRRRQCVKRERGNPFRTVAKVMVERGNPLWKVTKFRGNSENEQIWTLVDQQREQILRWLSSGDWIVRIPGWLWPKKYAKMNWNDRVAERRNSSCSTRWTTTTRSSTSSWTVIEAKLDLREAHEKSLNEMEELKRFQGPRIDTIARRRLVEDQDTILELTGKIQEFQNEINCVNDSRDFSRCWISTQWTFPRYQTNSVFPTSSSSWWNAEPQRWAVQVFGTRMVNRETFLQIHHSTLSAGIESVEFSGISEPIHSSTTEMPVRSVSQKFSHP